MLLSSAWYCVDSIAKKHGTRKHKNSTFAKIIKLNYSVINFLEMSYICNVIKKIGKKVVPNRKMWNE